MASMVGPQCDSPADEAEVPASPAPVAAGGPVPAAELHLAGSPPGPGGPVVIPAPTRSTRGSKGGLEQEGIFTMHGFGDVELAGELDWEPNADPVYLRRPTARPS